MQLLVSVSHPAYLWNTSLVLRTDAQRLWVRYWASCPGKEWGYFQIIVDWSILLYEMRADHADPRNEAMKLQNGTYVTHQGTKLPVEVSPEAYDILIDSRFPPSVLAQTHLGDMDGATIGALDIQKKEIEGYKVTSFLLSGDLVIWTLTEQEVNRAFVFLPTEYTQLQPLLK